MREEDVPVFNQAVKLAQSGQSQQAYEWFKRLLDNGNQDIELLFWVSKTTPFPNEAQSVLDIIERREPAHPSLAAARNEHVRKVQQMQAPQVYLGPIVMCPYCGTRALVQKKSKLNTGGWVLMGILLAFGMICFVIGGLEGSAPLVVLGVVFGLLSLLGLAFRERYNSCGYCGARVG